MNLELALSDIASHFNLDPSKLIEYAYEDKQGGWDEGNGEWPVGSIWTVEGRVLYALVRATRPLVALELGTHYGCSTMHILTALEANGDNGRLIAVDATMNCEAPGVMIPDKYRKMIEPHAASAVQWLFERKDLRVDFLFEDLDHSEDTTRQVWEAAQTMLADGGFIVTHDAMHPSVGVHIRKGILASGATTARFYGIVPSDCGLAIARASGNIEVQTVVKNALSVPVEKSTPVDKPKRKRSTAPKTTRTRKAK